MPNEKEAKFKVPSHQAVLAALKRAGAKFLGAFLQTDRYFDLPGGRLRRSDVGLRIRTAQPIRRGSSSKAGGNRKALCDNDVRPLITFKGPRQPGKFKVRSEFQTHVDDDQPLAEILRAAGLEVTLTIQKRRSSYLLRAGRGPCRVELDELPLLGLFVEIEGPSEEAIEAACRKLGLMDSAGGFVAGPSITAAYTTLARQYCIEHGLDTSRVVF